MEDKNIDRLYQEQLKNLEATPNKRVWNNIKSKLTKKKRRILPMWWFSAGIAAVLILGLLLFPFSNEAIDNDKKLPIIITAPEINKENINAIENDFDTLFNKKTEKTILVEETKKNNNFSPKKNDKRDEKPSFLIADKRQKNIEKETKDTVSKKAMKKVFLTDSEIKKTLDSIKNTTIIAQENVLEKKIPSELKESIDINKKLDTISKNKINVTKPKKDFLTVINTDKKEIENTIKKRWAVSPVVAVLNSNSFSNASPIDNNLSNSTTGNNSYSYGIKIAHQLNNKWTIQSGIHLQEISFSNNQIVIVSTNSNASSISFNTGGNFSLNDASVTNINANNLSLNAISLDGNLTQKFGYVEIPIEVKYNFLESKKLKTQVVVGFSSLFLNKNSIDLNANSFSRSGKATNLNSINFSGNVGLDFNYLFNKNWSLNLNPMFKTQLNTFSKNSNGFKPFFIGVYTGINYQF